MSAPTVEADIPEVAEFRAKVRAWLAAATIPQIGRDADEAYMAKRQWQRQLYKAGLLGVDWPKDCGGLGYTAQHQLAAMEELIRAKAPFPAANVNLYVVGPTLCAWGTPEQKQRHLPRILSADEIWCQGFSEPNSGSDLASLRTKAEDKGAYFLVNGHKIWTSQAQYADFCALMARTDPQTHGHEGISYLIVDMKAPGVAVRPIRQITGDAMFNEVFFDNVQVPKERIIGALHQGWRVAMRSLSGERSSIILQRKAEAEAVFRYTVEHLRSHFGVPESRVSPEIALRVGHARMQLAALDGQVREMVSRIGGPGTVPGQESIDKLILTEVEQEVFSLAFDLLGPYRQVPDGRPMGLEADRLIREFLYSRSYSISAGTTQIQRNIVAQKLLGLPRA